VYARREVKLLATKNATPKPLGARVHPAALATLDKIARAYTTNGLQKISKQEHVGLAIMAYAKTLHDKGVKPGDDIREKLGL